MNNIILTIHININPAFPFPHMYSINVRRKMDKHSRKKSGRKKRPLNAIGPGTVS